MDVCYSVLVQLRLRHVEFTHKAEWVLLFLFISLRWYILYLFFRIVSSFIWRWYLESGTIATHIGWMFGFKRGIRWVGIFCTGRRAWRRSFWWSSSSSLNFLFHCWFFFSGRYYFLLSFWTEYTKFYPGRSMEVEFLRL